MFDPGSQAIGIDPLSFADIVIPHPRHFRGFFGQGVEFGAVKEGQAHIGLEAMHAEKPGAAIEPIKRRVPFDGFLDARDGGDDQFIDRADDTVLPAGHCRDVRRDRCITNTLGDLRIVARKQFDV